MVHLLTMKGLGAAAAVAALSGCAALERTRPGDMTVPGHEHAAQLDVRKAEEASKAATAGGRGEAFQRLAAQRHRELAAEHTAAAAALRKEVSNTCADADDASRSLAASKVAVVEPMRENETPKRLRHPRGYYPERLKGARIALEVDDGSSLALAKRSVECEAARAAALVEPVDSGSPLAVRTAKAVVRAEGPGIIVEVRGDGQDAAEEILRRAAALAQASPQSAR